MSGGDSEHEEWLRGELDRREKEHERLVELSKYPGHPRRSVGTQAGAAKAAAEPDDELKQEDPKRRWTEPTDDDEYYE